MGGPYVFGIIRSTLKHYLYGVILIMKKTRFYNDLTTSAWYTVKGRDD